MEAKTSSRSIFAQELDRAIFVTYFLGGVVPLMGLGVAMNMYVFPALASDTDVTRWPWRNVATAWRGKWGSMKCACRNCTLRRCSTISGCSKSTAPISAHRGTSKNILRAQRACSLVFDCGKTLRRLCCTNIKLPALHRGGDAVGYQRNGSHASELGLLGVMAF